MCTPCCPSAGPVPKELADIAGHWTGGGIELTISADGGLNYVAPGKSISASVSKWDGDDFEVTVCLCCGKKFHVDENPHKEDENNWKMKVNGILMTRD